MCQPYRGPAEEVVLVWFQMNSGMVEWMTLSTRVVFFSFWFTCEKGSVKANRTKQKIKINIVFGPDQVT